jgi:K+-transporting ATPase ATPase A chain
MPVGAFTMLPLFLAVLIALAYPLGAWLARIAGPEPVAGPLGALERGIYRIAGVDPAAEMGWRSYALALILFNALGVFAVYALQRGQAVLPWNPQGFAPVTPDSAFNTAVSFVTNTNWQAYSGEAAMSYFTQMCALAVQNFLSAATGMAVAFALIRGFARRSADGIGNFWVDLTRGTLYVLLPLSTLVAVILMAQGVIQNFDPYRQATTVERLTYEQPRLDAAGQPLLGPDGAPLTDTLTTTTQLLPMGPVASQEAIKMIGTNGGGFFNANSAHPFENPTPLSNFVQMIAMFLIPTALCFVFGRIVNDPRQGWAVLGAMTVIFVAMAGL